MVIIYNYTAKIDVDFHSPLEGWTAKPDGVEMFNYLALPKNPQLKQKAMELRKSGVLSEVIFWRTFKDKKKIGWDIDRQVIIGDYIVDFFIPELGLVFEIDGESHRLKEEYDVIRDSYLKSLGLKIIHIEDILIKQQIHNVNEIVQEAIRIRVEELKDPPRQPPAATPQEGNKNLNTLLSSRRNINGFNKIVL